MWGGGGGGGGKGSIDASVLYHICGRLKYLCNRAVNFYSKPKIITWYFQNTNYQLWHFSDLENIVLWILRCFVKALYNLSKNKFIICLEYRDLNISRRRTGLSHFSQESGKFSFELLGRRHTFIPLPVIVSQNRLNPMMQWENSRCLKEISSLATVRIGIANITHSFKCVWKHRRHAEVSCKEDIVTVV